MTTVCMLVFEEQLFNLNIAVNSKITFALPKVVRQQFEGEVGKFMASG